MRSPSRLRRSTYDPNAAGGRNSAHRPITPGALYPMYDGPPKQIPFTPAPIADRIELYTLAKLKPAQVNDVIYKPVDINDPTIIELGKDIAEKGLLEAIVATLDDVIIAGHRRRVGCILAGLQTVKVRRELINSTDPLFIQYLVSFNKQRVKTAAEVIREEVVRTSPEVARNDLLAHRATEAAKAYKRVQDSGLRILTPKDAARRSAITSAKRPMLDAAITVLEQYRDYWPLTLRQIHYRLLTRNVLRNSNRKDSTYKNDTASYKDLSDLLSRARLIEAVPWESMHDPTRPRTSWAQWETVGSYMREQLDEFLGSYKRNLLQSQPAYVELVVEKITVQDIAERAAGMFHVPVGVGRGYTSVTTLDDTADRFLASGKDKFILLIAGDLDPEGENICDTWASSLRDEHGVGDLTVVKVGVNPDQVTRFRLDPLPMKTTSSRAAAFKRKHGDHVYELEAFEPDQLQTLIQDAIRNVLDMNLFAEEQRQESEDARHLTAYRKQVCEGLKGVLPV
ncbi:MAG: ParB domain protein nuclease [Gemmataceae bacterium]|nr:ParB domain protein nuclease [Gemmataceae bacterium]